MTDQPTDGGVIRTARLNSLSVLLTRVINGLALTQDEARLLVEHVGTEVSESTTARELAHAAASTAPLAAGLPLVKGRCPACGTSGLFLGDGGYVTCSLIDCPQPDAATEVIADFWDARQHGAFTFCAQDVGHVTMTEFAKKITEKVTAVGQRAEAVAYANEQKQRADQLEELLAIAHETSNTAETERARLAAEVDRLSDWYRALSTRATTAEAERDRYHDELAVNETDRIAAVSRVERAEAVVTRVRELRDTWLLMTLEPGQVRRLLDGITTALVEQQTTEEQH